MKVEVKPGKYVVAVSGGVDSMALLDLLRQLKGLELVVAHFDHGIRPDSAADRELVEKTANRIKIRFKSDFGHLGKDASEAEARAARYDFLRQIQQETGAAAIITAHHQDDVLETAIINLLRGTNRRGLTSLKSTDGIIRPLLNVPKQDLINYAEARGLEWHEDSTNTDDTYLRNYVRHQLLPRFTPAQRQEFLALLSNMKTTNDALDALLSAPGQHRVLDRKWFISLPHAVAKEQIVAWLRANKIGNYDKKTVDRLTIAGKTTKPGARIDIINGWQMAVGKTDLALEHAER